MIRAIYKRREDGDYDFVAAFETEQMPALPSNWPEEICEWLNAEGELPMVVENIDLARLPDVWDGKSKQPRQRGANIADQRRSTE